MRKFFITSLICLAVAGMAISSGCTQKAGSANEAIESSKTLATVQEKTDYLVKQAEAFYNSKEFQNAVEVAQYVLSVLDKDSQAAKNLIEKAKTEIQAAAQKAVGDVGNKFFNK